MPIISKVESKSWRGRAIFAVLFLLLSLGGLTMLYPFTIMVSGSLRSDMDQNDLDLVPDYLRAPKVLYRKFLETKYNYDIRLLGRAHQRFAFSFRDAYAPSILQAEVDDFQEFHATTEFPRHWQSLGGMLDARRKIAPRNLRAQYDGDLNALSRDLGASLPMWNTIILGSLEWYNRRFDVVDTPVTREYFRMQEQAPLAELIFVNISGYFLELMILPSYGRFDTIKHNEAHGTKLESYAQFVLPRTVPGPEQARLRQEWIEFVQNDLHPSFVALDRTSDNLYRDSLHAKYGDLVALSQAWGTNLTALAEIRLPQGDWLSGSRRADYLEFLLQQPPETYRLLGPEYAWPDWLQKKYGRIDNLNAAYGTHYHDFPAIRLPVNQIEYAHAIANAGPLRREFAFRNYINVLRDMVFQGRAFANTVILCVLTVGLTLLLNPLAAYAMSRFRLPGTYKILLFLMVTMAFPAMVVTVPKFLILRKLNLLNSFAALVLPFIANGYLIFLLKGFFDSLPRDLYEAALIDGAGELRMFFQITMALSKPILAVVALSAFNSAYTMFLYALIVCPDQSMWTINVWLYQWQQDSPQAGVFASLLVAAVPTLCIFLFAQNVIMRGIVVPTEK